MPDRQFLEFRDRLIQLGMSARQATRAAAELEDHYDDLRSEMRAAGLDARRAAAEAALQLGCLDAIGTALASDPALRHWAYRYPRLGRSLLPIASSLLVPLGGINAGAACASAIARWSAMAALAALVTATMFLGIQMSITLG